MELEKTQGQTPSSKDSQSLYRVPALSNGDMSQSSLLSTRSKSWSPVLYLATWTLPFRSFQPAPVLRLLSTADFLEKIKYGR